MDEATIMSEIDIAKKMIKVAKEFCDVDIVKFQKRCQRTLLKRNCANLTLCRIIHMAQHMVNIEFLEFNLDQHKRSKELLRRVDVEYSSSIWDVTSAKEIISLKPKMIKVPSAVIII